jgi:hypothetical protein
MLSRRYFLISNACCAAHAFGVIPAFADAVVSSKPFACSTIDPALDPANGDPFQLPVAPTFDIPEHVKTFNMTPFGAAFLSSRWLRDDGQDPGSDVIKLGVGFFNGTSSEQQVLKSAADAWNSRIANYIVFVFEEVNLDKADIRVKFDPSTGNKSLVGRAAKGLTDTSKSTMDIADVDPNICEHELGHALGLQHEHQFPGKQIKWNEQVVIAYMKRFGWKEKTTREQILNKLPPGAVCIGDPNLNIKSTMMYWTLPGWAVYKETEGGPWKELIVDSQPISDRDAKCVKGVYSFKGHL